MVLTESAWDDEKKEIVERLLNGFLAYMNFSSSEDVCLIRQLQSNLLVQESGSISFSHGCSSPGMLLNDILWTGVSVYWIWKQQDGCCLNFLARQGESPEERLCRFEQFQWTLEASIAKPLQTFWKVAQVQLSCVELTDCTLMANIDERHNMLLPQASFSCPKVSLCSALPKTAAENIQLARLVSALDALRCPQLQWDSPPVPHLQSTIINTFGDILRHVFSFLEDVEEQTEKDTNKKQKASTTISNAREGGLFHRFGRSDQATRDDDSRLPSRLNIRQSMGDSLAMTAGCVATGASFVTPIGAAVSVAAMGVKDGVAAAANKGTRSRNAERYRFGDVGRGVVATVKEKREHCRHQQEEEATLPSSQTNNNSCFMRSSAASRYIGAVGSCAGAAVGMTLAGPVGLVAGSLVGSQVGSHATRAAVSSNETTASGDDLILEQLDSGMSNNDEILRQMDAQETRPQAYRFGDFTRSMVALGKQANGRTADSPYQFGDFSRGFFTRK